MRGWSAVDRLAVHAEEVPLGALLDARRVAHRARPRSCWPRCASRRASTPWPRRRRSAPAPRPPRRRRSSTASRSTRRRSAAPPCAARSSRLDDSYCSMSAYIDSVPPASSAAPSRSDLHSRQLCATAPRSRTTSVVTGSSARSAPTVGANWLSSRSSGSVSRSHTTGSTTGAKPSAARPARTRGTKSATKISPTIRKALSPNAAHERGALLGADHRHVDGELLGELGEQLDRRRPHPAPAAAATTWRRRTPPAPGRCGPRRPRARAPSTGSATRTAGRRPCP